MPVTNDVRVIIGQINGTEIEEGYREYELRAEDIPYDPATSVKEAIDAIGGVPTEERLISVKYLAGCVCVVEAALLVDSTINFLKAEVC